MNLWIKIGITAGILLLLYFFENGVFIGPPLVAIWYRYGTVFDRVKAALIGLLVSLVASGVMVMGVGLGLFTIAESLRLPVAIIANLIAMIVPAYVTYLLLRRFSRQAVLVTPSTMR